MKITIDTSKATNYIGSKLSALRAKFREARLNVAARNMLREQERMDEVTARAAALQHANAVYDKAASMDKPPPPRGTSRNKAAVQPRKRSPVKARS